MPLWLRYVIGAVLGVLLAVVVSPYPPAPISTLLFWVGWIVFAVCAVMAVLSLIRSNSAGV